MVLFREKCEMPNIFPVKRKTPFITVSYGLGTQLQALWNVGQ